MARATQIGTRIIDGYLFAIYSDGTMRKLGRVR